MAIKIVDLPIKDNDCPVRYVSLPEGNRILVGSASGGFMGFLRFNYEWFYEN